jgi:hypothetical protein
MNESRDTFALSAVAMPVMPAEHHGKLLTEVYYNDDFQLTGVIVS